MTAFTVAFIFMMIFTIVVGIGAVIFVSFDDQAGPRRVNRSVPPTQRLYEIVRRINTETIETVDTGGTVQRWTRSTH